MLPGKEEEPTAILTSIVRSFYLASILLEKLSSFILEVTNPLRTSNLENLLGIVPEKYGECDYGLSIICSKLCCFMLILMSHCLVRSKHLLSEISICL